MQVVINKRFGGFGISSEALLELIKMKSKLIQRKSYKKYFKKSERIDALDPFVPFKNGYKHKKFMVGYYLKKGDVLYTQEADEDRTHPDLIKIVKKLGVKVNSPHSELAIVEIPNGVDYIIEEYDGNEHIEERHRTWY